MQKDTSLVRYVKADWISGMFGIQGKGGVLQEKGHIFQDPSVISQIENLKGQTFVENQFLSTSANENKNFFKFSAVRLEIHAPKGTHCYIPDNPGESEVILDIGQKLKIIDCKVTDRRVEMICEIVGGAK